MNIIITGGNGFLGSKLAKKFVSKGHKVNIFDIKKKSIYLDIKIKKKINFHKVNITSLKSLLKINVKKNTILLHCAGQPSAALSFQKPTEDLEKNIKGMLNIIEFSKKKNIEKIVFASTFNVYKENFDSPKLKEDDECTPKSLYAISKLAAENYLKIYASFLNVNWNILRMFNVYGPGQDPKNKNLGMINIFLNMARKNSEITVKGSLKRFRDFIYIDDVIEAWYKVAVDKNHKNKIYNLGSGKKVDLKELFKIFSKVLKKKLIIKEIKGTPGDFLGCYADISNIKKDLRFYPKTKLINGILNFNNWLDSYEKL